MRLMSGLLFAAAAAVLFLGCGSTEEASQPQAQVITPTPSAAVTPTATTAVTASATPAPTDTPVPTTPSAGGGGGGEIGPGTVIMPPPKPPSGPIPPDWGTLTAQDHTIRHPDSWFSKPNRLSSWTPGADDIPAAPFRADGIRIDFGLAFEPLPAPKEASAFAVDGLSGWEVVRSYDPSVARGIAQVHELYVEGAGFAATFVGGFGPDAINEDLFWQIVFTFEPTP